MVGGVLSKNGGANSNQAHLGPLEDSSRRLLLLEEATLLAWASWAASFSPISSAKKIHAEARP